MPHKIYYVRLTVESARPALFFGLDRADKRVSRHTMAEDAGWDSDPCGIETGFRSSRSNRRRARGESHAVENLAGDLGGMDGRNNA